MKTVLNWLIVLIFLVQSLAFLIGFGPFENNIMEKDFLPKNSVLKPLSIAGIILAFLIFLIVFVMNALNNKNNGPVKYGSVVLLTKT
jgi:preprotein translocase subunit SecG